MTQLTPTSSMAVEPHLVSRLTAELLDGRVATILGPERALTFAAAQPSGTLAIVDGTRYPYQTLFEDGTLRLLAVTGDWDLPRAELRLTETPRIGEQWSSYGRGPNGPVVFGQISRVYTDGFHLEPSAPVTSGAPVLIGNQLAGLVLPDGVLGAPRIAAFLARAELFGRLSFSSRASLARADALRHTQSLDKVHMEHLIGGLWSKTDGPTKHLFARHGIDSPEALNRVLAKAVEGEMPLSELRSVDATATRLPPLSAHTEKALQLAAARSRERQSPQIQSRDLLHGALSVGECDVIRVLRQHGIGPEEVSTVPDSGAATARSASPTLVPCYDTDRPDGVDLLDITGEVEALCRLLAYKKADPPISVGLFGDWGSGKTFFMEKMEKWLLSHRAEPNSLYCSDITCIRFNAWHFIDKELWASLTAEVFEQLGQKRADRGGDDAGKERESLLLEQELAERNRKEAEARLREQEEEAARIEDSITSAAIARNAFLAVATDQTTEWEKAAEALNLPALKAASSAARQQWLEWRGVGGFLSAMVASLSNSAGRRWFIWGGFGTAVAGLALWTAKQLDWAGSYSANAAAGLLGAVTAMAPFLRSAKSAMAAVNRVRVANEKLLLEEKRRAEEKTAELRRKRDQANEDLARVSEKIKQLEPEERLANYISQRRESTDYTQHFGVVARSRRDFARLSLLLGESCNGDGHEKRIILFIDDLDRCPEKIVMEVLQAVHLLLAFPLFVVVVAVDSRWLLHSLKDQSKALGDDNADVASPVNYLEKIFQIPFRLKPRGGLGAFDRLIDELAGPDEQPAQPSQQDPRAPQRLPEAAPSQTAAVAPDAATAPESAPVQAAEPARGPADSPGGVPAPAGPELVVLEEWERTCMKAFAGLIPTPRAAKRYLNTYRLLRSMTPADRCAILVGTEHEGDHRAVLLLLALLTGYPDQATKLLAALPSASPRDSWWRWFDQQDLFDDNSPASAALGQAKTLLPQATTVCEPFVRWAGVVARFSFHPAVPAPQPAGTP